MVLSVNLRREFIPKWNGNDKASASEQIKIVHRPATVSMKERLFPREFSYGLNGEVKGIFTVDRKKIIKEFTIELVNIAYQVEGEKDIRKIKTVDELFDAPPEFDSLIDEIYGYYQDLLNNKVDEKNSE